MTMSHSQSVIDMDFLSQEFRDVDRLAMICSFHRKGEREDKSEEGLRMLSKTATLAKTHWVQVRV